MIKFYLCKLCLIVFGVLLAVQNVVAAELPKISPAEVEEAQKAWVSSVPKEWVCLDVEIKQIKAKLVFDSGIESVTFYFKGALGEWYEPNNHELLVDQPNSRVYWNEKGHLGYLRYTAMNLASGRMEEHSLRTMIGSEPPTDLIKHGLILYDCVPL